MWANLRVRESTSHVAIGIELNGRAAELRLGCHEATAKIWSRFCQWTMHHGRGQRVPGDGHGSIVGTTGTRYRLK
jgi:hypothetical protein